MNDMIVNPVNWSADYLISLGVDAIHDLALRSAATLSTYRLLLGRCLLAVERTKLYQTIPCSSTIHYACLTLGLRKEEARTLRRVAQRLEELPRLSVATELGQIPWGKLRESVRKATAETEEFWLELAPRMSYHEIERLVRATAYGKLPWEEGEETESSETRLHLSMSAETNEMLKRAVAALSRKFDKAMSPAEALEHLLMEHLAKNPVTPEVARVVKKEADRDVAAARHGRARLVLKARELAGESLAGREQDSALEEALGGQPIWESDPEEQPARAAIPDDASLALDGQPARAATPDDGSIALDEQPARTVTPEEASLATGEQPARVTGASVTGPVACDRSTAASRDVQSRLLFGLADKPISAEFMEALKRGDWKNGRLHFNPKTRLATPAQRRELMRRDGYCCATPGCPNHTWLELHHVVSVSDNGETVTYNLVTLCSGCHRNVHKGLLKIQGNADQALTFRDAEGRDLARTYGLAVAGWLNLWVGWSGSEGNCYMQRWAVIDGPPLATDDEGVAADHGGVVEGGEGVGEDERETPVTTP